MDRLIILAIVIVWTAGVILGALWYTRSRGATTIQDQDATSYMATRRLSDTGRRSTDLCPDGACPLASRAHQRLVCGNVYVTVGQWSPKPDDQARNLTARGYTLDDFAARLPTRNAADVVADDFATPTEAHIAGLATTPRERPVSHDPLVAEYHEKYDY